MRRLILVAVLVLVAAVVYRSYGSAETGTGGTLTLPQPAPNVGAVAPSFELRSEEGRDFELSDEGIYVLAFWSTLNRQSNQSREGFERLASEFANDDVEFAAVYVNSAPNRESAHYEVLRDRSGALTQSYNIKRVPRLFLIEDGRVRLVQTGFYEEYDNELEAEIRAYLSEQEERAG
ncbi:AhpC/TSA family [Rubrobacter radiotolerans]|uniref:AhpC/TSA family n=1 Tax=Rubrobacter radiotolerans TaxID=42256 RepID=A0A023X0C9_RUBRA|nr:redoxin domain-containing protein [Rubrobacter radiotolerans]AHY45798.1 AhpC/TSA family [Rubrobacter radiotolerans]MDX5893212.1 redoxin domain-containing protein [Rubrobacter radiotolerans]SMC03281.1 Peroxiredoxin [Rubrobacter radiotolerans DSM 5868]